MKEEELYVSITPNIYRKSKSNVLLSQMDILQTLKKLHNLEVLHRQKQDLKKELKELATSAIAHTSSLQEKMPAPKIPKVIQRHEEPKLKKMVVHSKKDEIEEELRQIQAKLQEINS